MSFAERRGPHSTSKACRWVNAKDEQRCLRPQIANTMRADLVDALQLVEVLGVR